MGPLAQLKFGEFRGQRQGEEAHRVFGNAVRRMRLEPFRFVGERWRDRQDVRIFFAFIRYGRQACEQTKVPRPLTPCIRS